jgi:crotonobetainyl-CoA:carnitine CoA-transferase CaiB-like acyl-CoA transferase
MSARARPPLAGIRVIDFTQVVAGPYATMMLADMGAEVVKIERAGHGDDLRRTVPYQGRENHQDYFNALNRSKKSLALNLKDPAQRDIALQLLARADVAVENFSPGTVDRLGVGWATARKLNPRLVYCSLSGFGQTGPYRNRPALDPIIQAVTGIMSVSGFPGGQPTMIGAPVADVIAGMFAAYTVVNALRLITPEGGGQYIDLSMQDAMLATVGTRMGETLQAGIAPPRIGNENPLRVPANTYRSADDLYLAVMVHDQGQWAPFCRALERTEWTDDPRYHSMAVRLQRRDELNGLVAERIVAHDSRYWAERFEQFRIPYAVVNDYAQALVDPQVAHRGTVREVTHPVSGKIRVVGPPWAMSKTSTEITAPPLLGQHTSEVLGEWLGMTPRDIEQLGIESKSGA